MRVLVILNEHPLGSHPDVYEALDHLVDDGTVTDYDIIPFLALRSSGVSDSDIGKLVADAVRTDGHDLVIWMHTGTLKISTEVLVGILTAPQKPRMAYWEADAYHPFYKPVPKQALEIMRQCDVVFVPCGGPMLKALRAAGVSEVRYAPSCASGSRFPHVWRADAPHEFDIVVIGNKVSSRVPFKTMPGAANRARLVSTLAKRYGKRVAIYGAGWTGPQAMGPCRFDAQSDVYRNATVTVGADNLELPWFFSNRLPIALASGIPTLYRRNPGFGEVFVPEVDARFFGGEEDVIRGIDDILSTDAVMLTDTSRSSRSFFEQSLSRQVVTRFVIEASSPGGVRAIRLPPLWQELPALVGGTRCM